MPILDDLPFTILLTCYLIIFAAGIAHGSLGMGFPMISTPLLALFVDLKSAILITLLPTIFVNIASIIGGGRWRDSIGKFWPLSLYAVIGSSIGTALIITNDPGPFKLLLAALIFLYMGSHWLDRLKMQWIELHPGRSMLLFGISAGIAAGSTNVMVPVLIVYTLGMGLTTTAMVQTFNLCFLAGKATQIAMFSSAGMLDMRFLISTSPLAAVALAGLFLGMIMRSRITTENYRYMLKGLLAITAIILITQFFTGY